MSTEQRLKLRSLNGRQLREAFNAGTTCLERYKDAINALNVFPVPDGDTGTNMLLTMQTVNEHAAKVSTTSVSGMAAAMARGALLGARGNSGVILSQFFNGFSQGLVDRKVCDGENLACALELAATASYSSVSNPVEGTMLTIIRELAQAADRQVSQGERNILILWKEALDSARHALTRTPFQLPTLQQAGVVDAGGQGMVVLMEGALCYLSGGNVDGLKLELCTPAEGPPVAIPHVSQEYLTATEEELYGYCTQFLLEGQGLDVEKIRQEITPLGNSAVVVGGEDVVKVHVHTFDPGPVISYGVSVGTIGQVKIDNIDQQHQEFLAVQRSQREKAPPVAVVAVAWGDGFESLLQELGCQSIIQSGQTMNPSTAEILEASNATGAEDVIVLPNNSNVIPAAQQAASLSSERNLHVVPSRTLPQGVAALLCFNPEQDLKLNFSTMKDALGSVRTVEITRAVRPVSMGAIKVKEGQFIALYKGDLMSAGHSASSVLKDALGKIDPAEGSVVTLYRGCDVSEEEAQQAAASIRDTAPGLELEVVFGGQPHYHYIVSVE